MERYGVRVLVRVRVRVRARVRVETNYFDPATPPPTHHPASPQRGGELFLWVRIPKNQGVRARFPLGGLKLDLKLIIFLVNSREFGIKREYGKNAYGGR